MQFNTILLQVSTSQPSITAWNVLNVDIKIISMVIKMSFFKMHIKRFKDYNTFL